VKRVGSDCTWIAITREPNGDGGEYGTPFSTVIASAAKQSISQHKEENGLLRCARNDGDQVSTCATNRHTRACGVSSTQQRLRTNADVTGYRITCFRG
jgi:hypothetical protein